MFWNWFIYGLKIIKTFISRGLIFRLNLSIKTAHSESEALAPNKGSKKNMARLKPSVPSSSEFFGNVEFSFVQMYK